MRRAFSLVELVIVAAVIGILAALVVPCLQGEATEAKVATAKDSLRLLRAAIELYAAGHAGVAPGYAGGTYTGELDQSYFVEQTVVVGSCLQRMPENPFNNLDTMLMIANDDSLPAAATGKYGWVYQPGTKTIRLDWPGLDRNGVRYFDY